MSEDAADAVSEMQAEAEAAAKAQTADTLECLIEAGTLQQTLDLVRAVGRESVFHLGRDGLDTRLVDPANVFMADIQLDSEGFADTGAGSFPIGLNIETLGDYLQKADDGTLVSLAFDTEKRRLDLSYGGYDANAASIDPDAIRDEPDIPDLDLPNTLTLEAGDYQDALEMCELVSDHFTIEGRPEEGAVRIFAKGDTDDMTVVLDDDDVISASVSDEVQSIFSLAYFIGGNRGKSSNSSTVPGFLKQIPSDTEVTIMFGEDFPIMHTFEWANGHGDCTMLCAPRIQSD